MSGSTPQKPSGQGQEGATEGVLFGSFDSPIATDSPLHIKDHGLPPQHQQPPRGSPQTSFQSPPSTQYNAGYQGPGSPQLQGGYPSQQTPPKQGKKLNASSSAFVPTLKPNAAPFTPQAPFFPQQPFYSSPGYAAPQTYAPPVFQPPFSAYPMAGYQPPYVPQNPRFFPGVNPPIAPIASIPAPTPKKVLEIRNPETNEIVDLNAKSTPVKQDAKPEEPQQEVKDKKETKPEAQPEPTTPEIRSEPDSHAPQETGEGQKKKEKKKKEFPLENSEEAIAQEQKEKEQRESEQREKEEKEQREQEEQDREQREREAGGDSQQPEEEEEDGQYDYAEEEEYEEPPYTIFEKFGKPQPEYPAGVWEPKSQTGSRKYDLDFLLQFQFFEEKPADFKPPPGFATPDKPRVKSHFVPKPRPPPPQQNQRGRIPMPNGGRGGRGPPPNFPPPANVKPLVQSENRWVRQSFVQSSDDEATFRKYRGLLNKLTVERFDAIAKEILDIEIPSALILRGLIHLIFDKATDEPNFAFMYANLCERVQKQKENLNFEGNNFRRLLLNKCQEEFEQKPGDEMKQLTEEDKKTMTEAEIEDYEYKRSKLKRRALGNITFIGELFKLSMLTEKIMHDCVTRLLGKGNDTDERDIECLCNLLKTVGKLLDIPKAEKVFQTYFERIRFLSTSDRLPSRIRFMLMDTIDLRSNKWIPRREELKAKKIDEVRQEVIEEENRKSSGGSSGGSRGGDNRRSSGRGGMPNIGQQIGGMRRTPSQGLPVKPKQEVADISKLHSYQKKPEQEASGPRSFAPPSFKKSTAPKAAPTPAPTSNKFSALMDEPKSTREPRSYDNSRSEPRQPKEQVKVEKAPEPVVVAPPIDNEKFNTTVTNNFEEYLQTKSNDDAEQYMAELKGCEIWFGELVSTVVNFVIEKKTEQQALAVRFLSFLLSKNILTVSHIVSGLHTSLEILDDLVVDIPGSVDFFARLLFGLATEGSLSLVFLYSLPALRTQESSKKLLASLFKLLVSQKGETEAAEILFRSAVDLSSLLGEDATPFLEKQNLGFLAKRSFANELTEKFLNSDSALQFIRKEVDEATQNSPGFGFVLMSTFLTTLEKEPNNLADRHRVLFAFFSEKEQLQVQALNAFQYFHQEKRLPEDRIDPTLSELYNANALSEKSLNQWKAEASLLPGKDELLAKLSGFFDWLSKAEPESGNWTW